MGLTNGFGRANEWELSAVLLLNSTPCTIQLDSLTVLVQVTSTLSALSEGFIGMNSERLCGRSDYLTGSIALIQLSGVLVASSSGTTGGMCITSSDPFVSSGCLQVTTLGRTHSHD